MGKQWLWYVGICVAGLVAGCSGDDDGTDGLSTAGTDGTSGTGGSTAGAPGAGRGGAGGSTTMMAGRTGAGSGGGGMTGSAGTAGTDGTAGGAGTDDDDAGVDCTGVANLCDDEGRTCDGDELVNCAPNAAGCLVETRTDCTSGANVRCDDNASPPACAGDPCMEDGVLKANACTEEGARCAADTLIVCEEDADGCPIAERTDCTQENNADSCFEDGDDSECFEDDCIGISNCDEEGYECDGTDLVHCERDADGCLVQEVTECANTAGQTCDPDQDPPECDPCTHECTSGNVGTRCNGDVFETCQTNLDADSCRDLVREPCSDACHATNGCIFNDDCDGPANPITDTLRETGTYGNPYSTTGAGNNFANFTCGSPNNTSEDGLDLLFALDVPADTTTTVAFDAVTGFGTGNAQPRMFLITDCSDDGADAEPSCTASSTSEVSYTNTGNETVRVYIVVDANGGANVGTFELEVTAITADCGDGVVDDSEGCDDGNTAAGDGCSATCTVANGWGCTQGTDDEPASVCTVRNPDDGICGNLRCALPENPTAEVVLCCTVNDTCGLAYPPVYGENCIEMAQEGTNDNGCDDETSTMGGYPTLQGCCRPDGECGLSSSLGLGCVGREAVWEAMQDSEDGPFYGGPFSSQSCN